MRPTDEAVINSRVCCDGVTLAHFDRLGEVSARLFVIAFEIERDARTEVCVEELGRALERFAIYGQRFVLLAFAHSIGHNHGRLERAKSAMRAFEPDGGAGMCQFG